MNRKNFQLNKFLKKPETSAGSDDKIQEKLYTWFEDQGLLSEFKAHIRQRMISALRGTSYGVESMKRKNSKSVSPKLQAVNLLISDYLLRLHHHYTLSVFFTEVPTLSNLSEFSIYISKLADKNHAESLKSEPLPHINTADVTDILQALGFPPDSHVNIRTRRMYQFNRENKALLMCLVDCLQANNLDANSNQRSIKKSNENARNELWPKEIRDVFIDSDLSFQQLEILQEHVTRYYQNAVKKLRAEEEAKYRLKVVEVLQKERETYGKLAETEKRLLEQQETIEKEIASREEQLKTLSTALRKQHDAITERLSQLQEESLKLAEKENQLKMEKGKEAEELEAKKSELELKEKELEEAYAKLAEEQKKIADEKKTLELTQKLISGSDAIDGNDPNNSVKFLQQLSQQCSALTQKLASIRSQRDEVFVEYDKSTSQGPLSADSVLFEQHKELINETKAKLEQKMNELILKLEEIKETHLAKQVAKNSGRNKLVNDTKDVEKEPCGFVGAKLSPNTQPDFEEVAAPSPDNVLRLEIPTANDFQKRIYDPEAQSVSQVLKDENENKIDADCSGATLSHKLKAERHLVKKLQEENTELRTRVLLQNQQIIDLTLQTRDLQSRLNIMNTVRVVAVNTEPSNVPNTSISAMSPYSSVVASAAPFALARPRRQWFNRHVGSGEESMFSSVGSPANSARSRLRELRRKLPRRVVPPVVVSQSSSTETSSGMDTLEESRKRLKRLERESCAVNRMYQDYQSKKEQNFQAVFQSGGTISTNSQPVYCADSQKTRSSLVTSTFRPYTSFRPICSTLRPIITSVLPQTSLCNQSATFQSLQKPRLPDPQPGCSRNSGVLKKHTDKYATLKNEGGDDCRYHDEERCSNRKFRHYYRDWLDSHFRRSCTSPNESDASRVSPLKQLFHLKQHRYKKPQVPTNRSVPETDDKEGQHPSLRVLHSKVNDDSLQVLPESKDVALPKGAPSIVLHGNESLVSSSDLDDSFYFERLVLQNQQNVAALRQKFENIQNFNSDRNSAEIPARSPESKRERIQKQQHFSLTQDTPFLKSNHSLNTNDSDKLNGAANESGTRIFEISSLDVNSNVTFGKRASSPKVEVNSDPNEEKPEVLHDKSKCPEGGMSPKTSGRTNNVLETSDSKQSVTSAESVAAQKAQENYRRLSLYNRLNDYYEEIINEMNISEEEKQNLSDIDQLLQPVVIDSGNFLKSHSDFKESSAADIVRAEPVLCVTEVESSHSRISVHSL